MAWSESIRSSKFTVSLNDGQTSTGGVKTVNVNLGALDKNGWDLQKAGNIVSALSSNQIFSKSIYHITRGVDYALESDE